MSSGTAKKTPSAFKELEKLTEILNIVAHGVLFKNQGVETDIVQDDISSNLEKDPQFYKLIGGEENIEDALEEERDVKRLKYFFFETTYKPSGCALPVVFRVPITFEDIYFTIMDDIMRKVAILIPDKTCRIKFTCAIRENVPVLIFTTA
jgi:hypothetical protein